MEIETLDIRQLLGCQRKRSLSFSTFIEQFMEHPEKHLQTSATLISNAIKYFGFDIVVRGGEPVLSYNIFKDPFSNGVNAVYGQEFCIKHIVEVIESFEKESSPKRGIVLVGPPASGKTNVVDLITQALENYTKEKNVKLYSFCFRFEGDDGKVVELRPAFMPNPILLFPIILQQEDGTLTKPRKELFDFINAPGRAHKKVEIPTYFQYANLDKRNLDILESLMHSPRNKGKTLFDIIEEYVRIEEIEFSNAQAKGIANVDNMQALRVQQREVHLGTDEMEILFEHLPGKVLTEYLGAMVSSNRGILHIHDAFDIDGSLTEDAYKPLLMLLGSGRISLQSTQASLDNTVIMTTNLEEMNVLEKRLSALKLLDRIDKVPVNYLLDAVSEMDILRRDMCNMRPTYDVDPNLIRIAAYYSVMTRLMPPMADTLPESWSDEKSKLYNQVTPEQKLFMYAVYSDDPVNTIRNLPHWHPFRNECLQAGINIFEPDYYKQYIARHPDAVSLEDCGLFSNAQLKLVDDEFMRTLRGEYYPDEGRTGLSIRQLQNIMRSTIAHSDGRKVTVSVFLHQLERIITEGPNVHHWLSLNGHNKKGRPPVSPRLVDIVPLEEGEGDFGDYCGLVKVVRALYYMLIAKEITVATVDRDPKRIELDLRKYLQHTLLARARENHAFAHIIVPKYTFVDPDTGETVDQANDNFMRSIEKVMKPKGDHEALRHELAQKFLDLQDDGELHIPDGKSVVSSEDDNLLHCFSKEYTALLSHRKAVEGISPETLCDAFFHKRNDPEKYRRYGEEIIELVETIIKNLTSRFGYSRDIALDTVVFALRHNVVDFAKMIL